MSPKQSIGFDTTSDADELALYHKLITRGCTSVQSSIDVMGEHMHAMANNLELLDAKPGLADSVLGDTARKMNRDSAGVFVGVRDFLVVGEAARTGRVSLSDETVLSVATYCETLTGMVKSCLDFESTIRTRQEDGYFKESGTDLLGAMATVRSRIFRAIEAVSHMCGPVDEETH